MPRNNTIVRQFYTAAANTNLPAPVEEIRENTQQKSSLRAQLDDMVIGQDAAKEAIEELDCLFRVGLNPDSRPAGSIILLGPSGCGKTRIVEAYAKAKHGTEKHILKIDCGEFQMEHEVAKLIGAPPGYLGHRETTPLLSQARLNAITSEHCPLSIILFDEIEKAAPSLQRLLLGALDKAYIRMGDNCGTNLERSMIFFTSNLGTDKINRLLAPESCGAIGFAATEESKEEMEKKLGKVGVASLSKVMLTEFINRVDKIVVCHPLTKEDTRQIISLQVEEVKDFILSRWSMRSPEIEVTEDAREKIFEMSYDPRWGAREVRRVVRQQIVLPIARLFSHVGFSDGGDWKLTFTRGEAGLIMSSERMSVPGTMRGKKAVNY